MIEKIEKSKHVAMIQALEEQRVKLHWEFMDELKRHNIPFADRDHATRIAIRLVNGEL